MKQPLRVLVVDDNPQDRSLVMRELRKAYPDAVISEAIDQLQLDERIHSADFDLVITDYHLQWSDGIQVLLAVKERVPVCPVIMFTGTGSEEIAVEAMKRGLDDYIIKNVKHLVRLRGAVQAVLDHAVVRKRADRLASRLESLLSQLNVGVFSCTPEGRFLDVNNAMRKLLETDFPPQADKSILSSLFSNEAEAKRFLQRVIDSEVPREEEFEITTAGDTVRVYRLNAQRITDDGEQPRIDGLLEDVSRRRKSEADARQAAVAAAQIAMLTPREHDVLIEVVAGMANKVIARRLNISEKTVEKHRASLMKKLHIRSVAELVRLALLAENVPG